MKNIYGIFKALGVLAIGAFIIAILINDADKGSPIVNYALAVGVGIGFLFLSRRQYRLVRDNGVIGSESSDYTLYDSHLSRSLQEIPLIDLYDFMRKSPKGFKGRVFVYGEELGIKQRIKIDKISSEECLSFKWGHQQEGHFYSPTQVYLTDTYLKIQNAQELQITDGNQQHSMKRN